MNIVKVFKYVDDIPIIGKKESIDSYRTSIEYPVSLEKLKFRNSGTLELTSEYEVIHKSLSYLEITITRSLHNSLYTNWYKKDVAPKRMLNYHSNHPK